MPLRKEASQGRKAKWGLRGQKPIETTRAARRNDFVKQSSGWLKKARRIRKKLKIKTWILVLILLPLIALDAFLLRMDHIQMTKLRDEVLALDEASDGAEGDAKTLAALDELRNFVNSHIVINIVDDNGIQKLTFGTGPFYLEHQYLRAANRALTEAEGRLSSDENPNGNIYGEAGTKCSALAIENGWRWNDSGYINCMLGEIEKYPSASELTSEVVAILPSTELYRREYAGPAFSFCLSGVMIFITAIIIVVILIRFLIWAFLRLAILFV